MEELKMKIECQDLSHYFVGMIVGKAKKLMDTTYKHCFENTDVGVDFTLETNVVTLFNDRFADHKGHITRKYVLDQFNTFESIGAPLMSAKWYANRCDNKIKITNLEFSIYIDNLNHLILKHISNLDVLIEMLDLNVKHEVGHLIDYISWDGTSFDDVIERMTKNKQELKKFDDFCLSADTDDENFDELFYKMYYAGIEMEATANANVGLTYEDFRDVSKRLSDSSHTVIIDIKDKEKKGEH